MPVSFVAFAMTSIYADKFVTQKDIIFSYATFIIANVSTAPHLMLCMCTLHQRTGAVRLEGNLQKRHCLLTLIGIAAAPAR